jgi:hypothetical protein
MELEEFKRFNLPEYPHKGGNLAELTLESTVIADAKIATTGEAWVRGFQKVSEEKSTWKFKFHHPISQHGTSRERPKRFPVYVFGLVNEDEKYSLAYATSMLDDTEEFNVIRLTSINQITNLLDYIPKY